MRIGVHTGAVIAGVVGGRKFAYDIWGDAVNVAARMESACEAGHVNVSESTADTAARPFDLTPRGALEVKNKDPIRMFFLDGIKAEFSEGGEGVRPNAAFRDVVG